MLLGEKVWLVTEYVKQNHLGTLNAFHVNEHKAGLESFI